MTPEGKVKQAIKKRLAASGAWWAMPMGTGWGRSGVPDLLVCHEGKFIAIEAKAPGRRGSTSALQDVQLEAIKAAGGVALVVDDVSQLDGVI